ncbi:hypothetical protein ACQKM9_01635 [Viridibacillus sp. NPDC093762]|uniref:hypothetical protein n=1 Tax=Viridibacillus sp. NPDC093762 TaxID=3390720 RepID=UPI003D040860
MNEVICMKRETLFKTEALEALKDEPLKMYSHCREFKSRFEQVKTHLLEMLHKETKRLYENENLLVMRSYLNIKKTIKKQRSIRETIIDELSDLQIQEHCRIYNEIFGLVQSIENQVEEAFLMKVNRYEPFLAHPEFQQALVITAYEAYEQLISPEITKDSINRARYRFIQRATVKTSPLSYLGKTTYLSDHSEVTEQIKLNNVVKYLLLMASLQNKDLDQVLQIIVRPTIKKCNGMEAVYYEKNYLLKGVDWVLKQDDLLHQKEIVAFLASIQHCKTPAQVKQKVMQHKKLTYELLVNNGLVIPDFNFYYHESGNFDNLLKYIFTERERTLLYPKTINEIAFETVQELLIGYLEQFSSKYYGQSYEEKLKNISLFYHDYVAFDQFNTPQIEKEFIQKVLDNYVTVNRRSYKIHQMLFMNKDRYDGQTVLAIFADIHEQLQFKKIQMPLPMISFNPSMKKSALLYLQSATDGSLVLNTINIGNGGVYHRYGHLFNESINNRLKTYYENLFTTSYPIYELVIDEEISNHIDVGKSLYPKLKWPEDFLDVKLQITNHEIKFLRNGKPIQLIYVGTVPYHLFTGIKSYLLQLIHPWTIDIDSKNFNKRESTQLDWHSISDTDEITDTLFYYSITAYFTSHNLPFEFFVKKKFTNFNARKPIWISLYSVESIKVLKHLLLNERSIEIEEVKPMFTGECVEEFCILATEGE